MLGKKHNLYNKDVWAGYEDDWAIDHYHDIWKRDFYMLWFKDELNSEEIAGAEEKFTKWNKVLEQKL